MRITAGASGLGFSSATISSICRFDGEHFIVKMRAEADPAAPITRLHLVQNWHQELLERVPIP